MLSHEYETIIIVRPDVEDSAVDSITSRFEGVLTENGAHVLDREDWGNRKLAYPIAKHLRGHYIRMSFLAPAELIDEVSLVGPWERIRDRLGAWKEAGKKGHVGSMLIGGGDVAFLRLLAEEML